MKWDIVMLSGSGRERRRSIELDNEMTVQDAYVAAEMAFRVSKENLLVAPECPFAAAPKRDYYAGGVSKMSVQDYDEAYGSLSDMRRSR